MCGPLATFAIGALQAAVSFAAASAEASATYDAARQSYQVEQDTITKRQMQEQEATAQKLHLQNIEEAQKRSEVELSAAEGNVGGISIGNLVADVTRRAATNRQTERSNLAMTVQQLQLEKKGSQARNQSRINASPKPSPLTLVAGIAGAGLDAYGQMQDARMVGA